MSIYVAKYSFQENSVEDLEGQTRLKKPTSRLELHYVHVISLSSVDKS